MKVALLCAGLGRIDRGHETFARGLFELLQGDVDITLFKGGGDPAPHEHVVPNLHRLSPALANVHAAVSPRWADAAAEQERCRIEAVTFAHAALQPLAEGGYDIVHCLEMEVANIVHAERHLFARTPKTVFSNGGAMPARDLPACDFVQEHTPRNLAYSDRRRAFMIPHGVDLERFHPGVATDFRARHGIPPDARVVISVGTVSSTHKRMDHVVREVAALGDAWLVIVGQQHPETPQIVALGKRLLGERVVFTRLDHDALPQAYAAADVFVLGSLFETFGIVYVEAMAMGLPVICTRHPNQRSIVEEGVFIDMQRNGGLTAALRGLDAEAGKLLGLRARAVAERRYDLRMLKRAYLDRYAAIVSAPSSLPVYTWRTRVASNLGNLLRRSMRLVHGRAE